MCYSEYLEVNRLYRVVHVYFKYLGGEGCTFDMLYGVLFFFSFFISTNR